MKVKFTLNSGANIHSTNDTGWFDTESDLGMDEGEWESMTDDQKMEEVIEYFQGMGYPEYNFEEKED